MADSRLAAASAASQSAEEKGVSIVLIGQFNPAIFSPAWLEKVGLASAEEADEAEVGVIHPDVANFRVGNFTFDVRRTRFSIDAQTEPYVALLDAVLVIFGENLKHTDISEYGINYSEHFSVGTLKDRVALGRALAPLAPWGDFGKEIGELEGVVTSGVTTLVMLRNYDPPQTGGQRVEIQPSSKIETDTGGVFITINDHRVIVDFEPASGPDEMLHLLSDNFDSSLQSAFKIVEDLKAFARAATK